MEQTSCGEYRYDYEGDENEAPRLGLPCMKCRQLRKATAARLKRTTRRSWDGYYITKSKGKKANISANAAAAKDIGCLTSDPKRVDTRCPWGERGGIVGGYSDAIAEDEHEHPFGMRECTFRYEYGDVTFYNRVFDGKQLEYVWGSCLESCPAFTAHPFCNAKSKAIEDTNGTTKYDDDDDDNNNNNNNKNRRY